MVSVLTFNNESVLVRFLSIYIRSLFTFPFICLEEVWTCINNNFECELEKIMILSDNKSLDSK